MNKRHCEDSTNSKSSKIRNNFLIQDCQEYDRFGRNISEQRRRQESVKWTKVKYQNGRLVDKGPI